MTNIGFVEMLKLFVVVVVVVVVVVADRSNGPLDNQRGKKTLLSLTLV